MQIVIRADASPEIGIGHIMRCLALGQAWQDAGGRATFLIAPGTSALETRLQAEGMNVVPLLAQAGSAADATETAGLARTLEASWVVVDGYHFGADFQRAIKDSGRSLLFVDDYGHAEHYYADLVLNQNLNADSRLYPRREPYTRLLLGSRYILLRREFLQWRGWRRQTPLEARKVLVTLGGGDPGNVTLKVIQALQEMRMDGLEARVVVGPSNPHFEVLDSATRGSSFAILQGNGLDIPRLMAWSDIAVSGAGTTCWELAFMKLPGLVIILADNQDLIARELAKTGALINLGWHSDVSCGRIAESLRQMMTSIECRSRMIEQLRSIVDGQGSRRVALLLKSTPLKLRSVLPEDCRLLWEWANDPNARQSSFSADPIPWEEHVKWFSGKLADSKCILLLALDDSGRPLGQIRFDLNDRQEAEIDVTIDGDKRGLGYGPALISAGVEEVFRTTPVHTLHAFVKVGNIASSRAFEKARFQNLGSVTVAGNPALHFVRSKSCE